MTKAFTAILLFVIIGCGGGNNTTSPTVKVVDAEVPEEVTAKDIAKALGMNSCVVRMPDGVGTIQVGFTYYTKDGIVGCAYGSFKQGTNIKLIYWIENDYIRYSMLSKDGAMSGLVDIKDIKPRLRMYGSPDSGRIYNINKTITKWSMGESLTSGGSANDEISIDEIGLIVVRQGTDFKPNIAVDTTLDSKF